MFDPDLSTRDPWAPSMVAAGTAEGGAEKSTPLAGGYCHEGAGGGGNGGRIPIKKSGGRQECGHRKGGRSYNHPGPLFGRAAMYRTC